MKSILIKNGIVYDGLGNPGIKADILLKNGRIQNIGRLSENRTADIIIDANNKVVCPGFVDIHRHCDMKPLNAPDFGKCELAQGITTVVVGNCGISPTPSPLNLDRAKEMYDFDEPVLGPVAVDAPKTYGDYIGALERVKLPLNMAAMIGTGAVRIAGKGFSNEPAKMRGSGNFSGNYVSTGMLYDDGRICVHSRAGWPVWQGDCNTYPRRRE